MERSTNDEVPSTARGPQGASGRLTLDRGGLRGVLRSWARNAFALDPRSLVAYRIALGGVLVADCLLRCRDFRLMHTAAGMFAPDAVRSHAGRAACWSLALASDADAWAAAMLALEGAAGLLLAAGLWSHVAAAAGWIAVVSIVRRTAPATNAGDAWLICQLFWACFLPLSVGAARGAGHGEDHEVDHGPPGPGSTSRSPPRASSSSAPRIWSAATVALTLQVVFVYIAAGLGKHGDTWRSGSALSHVLSVHDHGTALGMALGDTHWLSRPLTRLVPGLEVVGAVMLVAIPTPWMRGLLVTVFVLFHATIWVTMSVGLFAPIAIAAWLPFVPSRGWDLVRGSWTAPVHGPAEPSSGGLSWPASVACWAAIAVATVGWVLVTFRPSRAAASMPVALDVVLDLTALHQEWRMFDDVPAQEQWVSSRAVLADGRIIDLLRGGREDASVPPEGGFTTLPHHRWHKLFWVLHKPEMRCFGPGVAAGLVGWWNARHGAGEQVRALEIRFGRRSLTPGDGTSHELLIATWPPRSATGAGGLERLLGEEDRGAVEPLRSGLDPR